MWYKCSRTEGACGGRRRFSSGHTNFLYEIWGKVFSMKRREGVLETYNGSQEYETVFFKVGR